MSDFQLWDERFQSHLSPKEAHHEAPLMRKGPIEILKQGGRGLIQVLKDSLKPYVYVNAKHTICEWGFGGGLKYGAGLRQQWKSSLFLLYGQIKEFVSLGKITPGSHLYLQ